MAHLSHSLSVTTLQQSLKLMKSWHNYNQIQTNPFYEPQSKFFSIFYQVVCTHFRGNVGNFTTVACNIHSQLTQYKHYKYRSRLARLASHIQNVMFSWPTRRTILQVQWLLLTKIRPESQDIPFVICSAAAVCKTDDWWCRHLNSTDGIMTNMIRLLSMSSISHQRQPFTDVLPDTTEQLRTSQSICLSVVYIDSLCLSLDRSGE